MLFLFATVTGLHDVDEYMQAQLLLAVSNPLPSFGPFLPSSASTLPILPPLCRLSTLLLMS